MGLSSKSVIGFGSSPLFPYSTDIAMQIGLFLKPKQKALSLHKSQCLVLT